MGERVFLHKHSNLTCCWWLPLPPSENTLDQDHTWELGTTPCLEAGNGVSVDSSPAKAEEGPEGVVWVMKSELRKS